MAINYKKATLGKREGVELEFIYPRTIAEMVNMTSGDNVEERVTSISESIAGINNILTDQNARIDQIRSRLSSDTSTLRQDLDAYAARTGEDINISRNSSSSISDTINNVQNNVESLYAGNLKWEEIPYNSGGLSIKSKIENLTANDIKSGISPLRYGDPTTAYDWLDKLNSRTNTLLEKTDFYTVREISWPGTDSVSNYFGSDGVSMAYGIYVLGYQDPDFIYTDGAFDLYPNRCQASLCSNIVSALYHQSGYTLPVPLISDSSMLPKNNITMTASVYGLSNHTNYGEQKMLVGIDGSVTIFAEGSALFSINDEDRDNYRLRLNKVIYKTNCGMIQ